MRLHRLEAQIPLMLRGDVAHDSQADTFAIRHTAARGIGSPRAFR
jgi:hypothetical protein